MAREDGWFKDGNDPRRFAKARAGARTKLSNALLEAFASDFEKHGPSVIERVRIEDPSTYLKVAVSVLPKDMTLEVTSVTYDEAVRALLNGSGVESGHVEQPSEAIN